MARPGSADDKADSLAGWILIGIFGTIGAVLIAFGSIVYIPIVETWAGDPRGFYGIDGAVKWIIGLMAALAIAVGLVLAGIVMRLLRCQQAPRASLVLAILGAGFVIGTYLVFSDTGHSDNSIEIVVLQACCIALLFVVPLPPFLHWAMAKPDIARLPTEPQP